MIRDKLLEIFQSEDQWVQQISAMKNKNDAEELKRFTNPSYSIAYKKNDVTIVSYECAFEDLPEKVRYWANSIPVPTAHPKNPSTTCWCLSGALQKINLTADGDSAFTNIKPFLEAFEEKYGEIDKFNDSHSYNEVIEAIKSIDK